MGNGPGAEVASEEPVLSYSVPEAVFCTSKLWVAPQGTRRVTYCVGLRLAIERLQDSSTWQHWS